MRRVSKVHSGGESDEVEQLRRVNLIYDPDNMTGLELSGKATAGSSRTLSDLTNALNVSYFSPGFQGVAALPSAEADKSLWISS